MNTKDITAEYHLTHWVYVIIHNVVQMSVVVICEFIFYISIILYLDNSVKGI